MYSYRILLFFYVCVDFKALHAALKLSLGRHQLQYLPNLLIYIFSINSRTGWKMSAIEFPDDYPLVVYNLSAEFLELRR